MDNRIIKDDCIKKILEDIPSLDKDLDKRISPSTVKVIITFYNNEYTIKLIRNNDNALIFHMCFSLIDNKSIRLNRLKVFINAYRNIGIASYYYKRLIRICLNLGINKLHIEMLAEVQMNGEENLNQQQLEDFYYKYIPSEISIIKAKETDTNT